MSLGNSVGAIAGKVVSIRQSDLGGGQIRFESDIVAEGTGTAPGKHYGTLSAVVGSDGFTKPVPFSYTGSSATPSGATLSIFESGFTQQIGNKMRYRGVARFSTTDPKLSAVNSLIVAAETEIDMETLEVKGEGYEWK
jgi:hypothetical protein